MQQMRFPVTLVLMAAVMIVFLAVCGGNNTENQQESTASENPTEIVSEQNLVRLTQEMVRINSEFSKGVVHNHKKTAEFLGEELKKIGVEVEVVYPQDPFEAPYQEGLGIRYPGDPTDFPVVVARLRGTAGRPVLGLTTHYNSVVIGDRNLWTVDPLGGEIIDDKIYGRGSTNSHASVAKRIEIMRVFKESGAQLRGDLVCVLVPGEGATEFGMPWVVANRPELVKADWYLAGSIGPVFTEHGGHIWAKLSVIGKMHHPGRAGVNAAHQMAEILPAVIDVDRWMTYEDEPLFTGQKPHVEATVITSGDPRNVAVNVMPAKVEALLDMRLFPNQEAKQVVAEMNQLLDTLMEENSDLTVEFEVTHIQKTPEHVWDAIKEDDPFVQEMLAFSREYTGNPDLQMEWRGGVGGGRPDFWNTGAIVTFAGGIDIPGGGHGAHSPDEYVEIAGLAESTQIMVDFIQRVLTKDIKPAAKVEFKK
jgi:acetylornithine deacetylase/succinyl-diaminopimelate desuccinylase-like protein